MNRFHATPTIERTAIAVVVVVVIVGWAPLQIRGSPDTSDLTKTCSTTSRHALHQEVLD